MDLRPYQTEMVTRTSELLRNTTKSVLITAPTGSGKTVLAAEILARAKRNGIRSLFLVHRRELIHQSVATFQANDIHCGVIANHFPLTDNMIQIASVQTLSRRLKDYKAPKLIVWDECHHIAASTWQKIYNTYPDARHIGLTATPIRMGGVGLSKWFTHMVKGPTIEWLINNGFLSPYRLFAAPGLNLSGVHTRMGDFVKSELVRAVNKPVITGCALATYQKCSPSKRAIVFCCSVEHSKEVVAQFNHAKIPSQHVDGETNVYERDKAISEFRAGRIKILSNVDLFGEGFDLPAVEVGILLRPTQSLGLYLQQVGRVLRPSPGKSEALIFDHSGNCERFGLPDEDREWSLQGIKPKINPIDNIFVRVCPICFAAQKSGGTRCKECGQVFPERPRIVDVKEGELTEIDKEKIKQDKIKEQKLAQSLEELTALGARRGYPRPRLWAEHVFKARRAKVNS